MFLCNNPTRAQATAVSRFLYHKQTQPWQDSSERVISSSQCPLPTQQTNKHQHKRRISMPSAGSQPSSSCRPTP